MTGQATVPFLNAGGNAVLYAVAAGGDAGHGANGAIKMMNVIGLGSGFAPSVVINERTTAASAWSLNQFFNGGGFSGTSPGLQSAASTVSNFVNVATGDLSTVISNAPNSPAKLDTIANLLASCIDSSGANSSSCSALFSNSMASGASSPSDTLAAALAIAAHPANNAGQLFNDSLSSSAYSPALMASPGDWTLAINFTGGGLNEPTGVALDEAGNVWVANYAGTVTELSGIGQVVSPAGGYSGGGMKESFGIAIDADGNAWVSNEQSAGSVNSGLGSITKLSSSGAILSGSGFASGGLDFPLAVAIDPSGNVWATNFGNSSVTELNSAGTALSPSSGFSGGGLDFPIALAIDSGGNSWIANHSLNTVTEFSTGGSAISPQSGYVGGGLNVPQAIAIDQSGNVWIANYYGNSLSRLSPAGTPLSPDSGYTGGGLVSPSGIAIDGIGNVWVANYHGSSVSEFQGGTGASCGNPLSPASGLGFNQLSEPFGLAIDSSGDLWVSNFGNNFVTEFIGVAAPVRTPRIGPPATP